MVLGSRSHPCQGLHRQRRGPDGRQAKPPAGWDTARVGEACVSRQRRRDHDTVDRSRHSGGAGPRGVVGGDASGTGRAAGERLPVCARPVHEAAYSLIPHASRTEAHLRIGRLLAKVTPPEEREEAIFEIVGQLNRGAALITEQEEREQLAGFNLLAGQRAKASTAYASALTYLITGAELLNDDCWVRRHELIFALELNRAECEFMTGQLSVADERLAALSKRAATTVEEALVACMQMDVYLVLDQSGRAVDVCLAYLRHVGIEWSPHPNDEEVRREYERIGTRLGGRTIEALIELPLMEDAASLATVEVLNKCFAPAVQTDVNLVSLTICKGVSLSIERGNCDASCMLYANVGRVAG